MNIVDKLIKEASPSGISQERIDEAKWKIKMQHMEKVIKKTGLKRVNIVKYTNNEACFMLTHEVLKSADIKNILKLEGLFGCKVTIRTWQSELKIEFDFR